MIIAVTHENGQIFQHFGHTAQFKLYDIQDNAISSAKVVDTCGKGHGARASLLRELGAEVLICGGIGGGARTALEQAGIALYGGVSGDADEAAEAFASGVLSFNPDACCSHHHGEGHSCGHHDHSCGHHSCGHHE